MDKHYLSPLELLSIATQHAYAADNLLQQLSPNTLNQEQTIALLTPVTSLMYFAFQLTLKAYALHDKGPIKEYKKLMELVELNDYLNFSQQELNLLKTLAKQHAFHRGFDYKLWENEQDLHVFCEKIMTLYEKLQGMMPLELDPDYQ